MEDHLNSLKEIKKIMESSTKFLSLSGLTGIFAGLYALIGAYAAWILLDKHITIQEQTSYITDSYTVTAISLKFYLILDACVVFFLALATGLLFTHRNARRNNKSISTKIGFKMLVSIFIPLFAGALFCLILIFKHQDFAYIAPATLIFYGLALINGSHYTFSDIKYLGITEIALGLINLFFLSYGIVFWAIGFGIMHIVYGSIMYFKYEYKAVK